MGWNTSMIILNDAVHTIGQDKDFGKKVYDAVLACNSDNRNIDISAGAATVIETHHADVSVMLAVGGNNASVLCSVDDWRHGTTLTQVKLLQELADRLGYVIARKRKQKS